MPAESHKADPPTEAAAGRSGLTKVGNWIWLDFIQIIETLNSLNVSKSYQSHIKVISKSYQHKEFRHLKQRDIDKLHVVLAILGTPIAGNGKSDCHRTLKSSLGFPS
jgi:hypothetical protein